MVWYVCITVANANGRERIVQFASERIFFNLTVTCSNSIECKRIVQIDDHSRSAYPVYNCTLVNFDVTNSRSWPLCKSTFTRHFIEVSCMEDDSVAEVIIIFMGIL